MIRKETKMNSFVAVWFLSLHMNMTLYITKAYKNKYNNEYKP